MELIGLFAELVDDSVGGDVKLLCWLWECLFCRRYYMSAREAQFDVPDIACFYLMFVSLVKKNLEQQVAYACKPNPNP